MVSNAPQCKCMPRFEQETHYQAGTLLLLVCCMLRELTGKSVEATMQTVTAVPVPVQARRPYFPIKTLAETCQLQASICQQPTLERCCAMCLAMQTVQSPATC